MAEPSSHYSFWFNPLLLTEMPAISMASHSAIESLYSAGLGWWLQICMESLSQNRRPHPDVHGEAVFP